MIEQYRQVAEAYIELAAMPAPTPSSDKVEVSTMPLPGKVKRVIEGCPLVPVFSQSLDVSTTASYPIEVNQPYLC